jgi:tetratricopeptide (TPR) repeat protein
MRPADYYQLGYAQYQQGDFIHAVNSFKEATSQDSVLSQNSFYHLGASLLKINNKPEAREAFKRASAMKGDPALRDDATVQYAKLSYELKKDREAINALQRIKSDSKNYSEAQNLLAALFMHTRDYQRAVDALEEISPRSAKLNEAYQSVTYHRALQLLNSGNKTGATAYLQKSLKHNTDKNIAAQCHFWLGSIAQDNNKFDESKKSLNTFITAAKTLRDLPDESNLAMGHYLQGYNLLKQEDFSGATANFKSALDLLKGANPAIRNANTRATILSDVQIRLGDCNFKSKNYDAAISAYEEVIRKKYDDADYAMLNLSVIYGLQDQREEKVTELNNFLNKFPKSKYVDEALLEQGKTFQEMGKFREMQVPLKRLVGQLNRSALVPEAYVLLGQSCFELNDLDAAISFYKKVFEFQPESKDRISACNGLREIYIDQKADAEGYLSLANSLKCGGEDISNDDLTFQTAQRQADQGKFTQAIDGFNNYIRKFPDGNNLLPAYNGRANAYVQIKNYSLALKDYQSIVRLGNSNYYLPAAKNGAYLAFNELKDPGTAVEMAAIWEESSRDEKDKLNARLLALEAAFLSGNAAKVYTLSQKIASSTSADGNQKNRAKYLQGISAFRNNDYPIALPALLQVSESDDEEKAAEAWACILQIYLKQNRFEDMETAFDTANDRTDGYPDFQASVFLSMAEMNFARKNTDEAQTILEIVEDSYQGDNQDVNKRIKDLKNKLKTNPGSKNKNSDSLLDMDDRNN